MRSINRWCVVISICVSFASSLCAQSFFIGTYTGGASEGIYYSQLDPGTGSIAQPRLVAKLVNPSFLDIHPRLQVLYAISEVAAKGNESSQVMAYRFNGQGELTPLGGCEAGGDGPCHVAVHASGKFLFVANYGSGSLSSFVLNSDGSIGQMQSNIQHTGSSVNPQRQREPHAHCVMPDPSGNFLCAADLGTDEVISYRIDLATGALTKTASVKLVPGSGPRHLAFHPSGKYAFVIEELSSTLSLCSWDDQSGKLNVLQNLSTLPEQFGQSSFTAEVQVHPSGNFVYGSNRGHDSVAIFAFDEAAKALTLKGHMKTGGKTPRNFRISPDGNFLLAENQQSDSIIAFRIDATTGKLAKVGDGVQVGSPCCIKFFGD
ncbi:MAG: lactonase family protein [Planctomycetales bacterium]|nr:lactonase family protein [Planctomycetales bacterium]